MQHWAFSLGSLFVVAALGLGCASVPPKNHGSNSNGSSESAVVSPEPKTVRHTPQRQIEPLDKLNPVFWFGNIDDPTPPAKYRPNDSGRKARWYMRNSCHNLTFYVIGIADKEFVRVGRHPARVFNPNGGWNWAVSKYRLWRLPFVSYGRGRFKFYCGWRNHGNFGMKLNFNSSDPLGPKTEVASAPTAEPSR